MQVYSAQWFKVHLTYIWDKINLSPIIHQVNTTMFDSSSSQDTCFLLTHSKKKAFVGMHTAHLCCIAIVQISGSTTCVQRERDVCPSRLMCSAQNASNMGKLCLSSNSQTFHIILHLLLSVLSAIIHAKSKQPIVPLITWKWCLSADNMLLHASNCFLNGKLSQTVQRYILFFTYYFKQIACRVLQHGV